MKTLHINTYDVAGGAERVAFDLMENNSSSYLLVKEKRSNHNRVIELPKHWTEAFFLIVNQILWKFGIKKSIRTLFALQDDFHSTYKILSKIPEFKDADIIHLHNIHGAYFDTKALIDIKNAGKKIIWTLHDMWALTGGEAYTLDDLGYKTGKAKTKYLNTPVLNNPIIDRRPFFLKRKKRIYKRLGKQLTFIVVSDWLFNCVKDSFVISGSNNLHKIYNGVNTDIFVDYKQKPNTNTVGFFYSKSIYKNCQEIIDLLIDHQFPNYKFIIVGIEPFNTKNDVVFIPYNLYGTELTDFYNRIDFLIFNSIAETFGLIPAEAMACGATVLLRNNTALPELVRNNDGILYNDIDELKMLLTKGKNTSHQTNFIFDLKSSLNQYQQIYLNIVDNNTYT